jgi:pyridoxine 5-phosphate synthase
MPRSLRLGVNIDHVATIRNARGGSHPDPFRAAEIAVAAGADGITAHLREDRRHISEADVVQLAERLTVPLNLEIAATEEMLGIAVRCRPHAACLVPERREERTTEGGLDAVAGYQRLLPLVQRLKAAGIRVTLFVEPEAAQIDAASRLGADAVELHTGAFCAAAASGVAGEHLRLRNAAARADAAGLECHAGHGISYDTVGPIAAIPQIVELNIGHFLIGEAIFCGLAHSVAEMRRLMHAVRAGEA